MALPYVSFAPAAIPLPPLGTVGIDPSTTVPLPGFAVPPSRGVASVSVGVPTTPSLIGITLYAQALLIQYPVQIRLTNAIADSILPR